MSFFFLFIIYEALAAGECQAAVNCQRKRKEKKKQMREIVLCTGVRLFLCLCSMEGGGGKTESLMGNVPHYFGS